MCPVLLIDYFSNCEDELAILTNGEDTHQRMKLEVLHVFDYFKPENVFTSGQIGVAKPDVNAFKKCMEVMHEDITEWYYVGDNYINDMQGAKNAGMKTIHFNRHHQVSGPCADHVVYSAKELVDFIKERYILLGSDDETQIIYLTDYSMKYVVIAMFTEIGNVDYCIVGYGDASDINSMAKTMKSEFVNLKPFIAERIKNGDINVANSNIREVKANIIEAMKR